MEMARSMTCSSVTFLPPRAGPAATLALFRSITEKLIAHILPIDALVLRQDAESGCIGGELVVGVTELGRKLIEGCIESIWCLTSSSTRG